MEARATRQNRLDSAFNTGSTPTAAVDFVGRALWLNGWFERTKGGPVKGAYPDLPAIAEDADDARSEDCIGLAYHNDYWHRTAPDMAHILDQIICA